MPEAVAEEKKVKLPPLPTKLIKRNDVEFPFVSTEFLRDTMKGQLYLSPDINDVNFNPSEDTVDEDGNKVPSFINWCGLKELSKKVKAIFNQMSQVCWKDALESATDQDTGVVDQELLYSLFVDNISSWGVRGENIKDLESRIEELTTLMGELDPDLEDPRVIMALEWMQGKSPDDYLIEFKRQFKSLVGEIKTLQAEIENKRRERKSKKASED